MKTLAALFVMGVAGLLVVGPAQATFIPSKTKAPQVDPCLRVNEVYAVGGTATSTYNRDFVELRNVCGSAQSFTGNLVVSPVAENSFGANIALNGISIPANGFYLVGFGTASGPGAAFTADLDQNSFTLLAGGLAGLTDKTIQNDPCTPVDGGVWFDRVAYGPSPPPCPETAAAPAPSETQSIARNGAGADTDNNSVDFTLQTPTPNNASTPTAVRVRSFSAVATKGRVTVRWRAASLVGVLGFHVYREVGGKRARANAELLVAARRHWYSFVDRQIRRTAGVRYWIQIVNLDGSRSWHGPAGVERAQ